MLQMIVHGLVFVVCLLTSFLIVRVIKLNSKFEINSSASCEKPQADADTTIKLDTAKSYGNRVSGLKLAQKFVGEQLVEVKKNASLTKIVDAEWLNEVASLYFIGAIDYIGAKTNCGVKCRQEITQLALKSNSLSACPDALTYFSQTSKSSNSENNQQLIKAGSDAAKYWLENGGVDKEFSLNELIGWWRYEFLTNRFKKNAAHS